MQAMIGRKATPIPPNRKHFVTHISLQHSVLDRASFYPAHPSLSGEVDGLVGGFVQQATDWRALAAMTAGGLAYRAGRIGAMGLGNGSVLQAASIGFGVTAEVSTFELTNRGLSSVGTRFPRPQFESNGTGGGTPPLQRGNSNL